MNDIPLNTGMVEHKRLRSTWLAIVAVGIGCVLVAVAVGFMQAYSRAKLKRNSALSINHLKLQGLALHNFHDNFGEFPQRGVNEDTGVERQSWMTQLLPYIEQEGLYDQIELNESWTAPSNRKPFAAKLELYLNPWSTTDQQSVEGLGAAHYAANSQVVQMHHAVSVKDIIDGTEDTILAGEIGNGYSAWADPSNVRDPAAGIGNGEDQFGPFEGPVSEVHFLMTSGSVWQVRPDISRDVLKALASPSGGDRAQRPWGKKK